VRTLDRKLLRDLHRMWAQLLTISLVIACGVAQLVAFVTCYRSMEISRDAFYDRARFADLFVHLERAPRTLLARIAEVPGIARVEGRVVADFRLDFEGSPDPVLARFVSLDGDPSQRLDALIVSEGRLPEPGSGREAVVSRTFADAHGIHSGDALVAIVNGRKVRLQVVGIGLSPEFIWAPNPRTNFPDAEHFGVVWMDGKALADAMGLSGAFNDALIALNAGARGPEVAASVERLLAPYGGRLVLKRDDQPSNFVIDMKIAQWKSTARFVPIVFLAVAAFLLNLVISRTVHAEREQIATLKALGYSTGSIARHYLLLAVAVSAAGSILGVAFGILEGRAEVKVLTQFFNLPVLLYRLEPSSVAWGAAVSLASGALGAFAAVRRTVRLPPAEAMQPEPPERFQPTILERLGIDRLFGVAGRMVLRDMERHPLRLLLSSLAVALAASLELIGGMAMDSFEAALDVQFRQVQVEDIAVAFDEPRDRQAIRDLGHVPGVRLAEPQRQVAVRLRGRRDQRDVVLEGVEPGSQLRRLRDNQGRPFAVAASGLTLSGPLGAILGVGPGDPVDVEVLEAGARRFSLPVDGFVEDFAGLSGYVDARLLDRKLDERRTSSGAVLSVDPGALADVSRRIEALPAVATFSRPGLDRQQFVEQEADDFRYLYVMLIAIASVITTGMVYNNARIALAVRSRDLATLRILGFTRSEVATVLLGEQAVQLLIGIGAGLALGYQLGVATLRQLPPELFRLAPVLKPSSAVGSAVVVLLVGLASALLVRRQADRLDLIAVLKAHD